MTFLEEWSLLDREHGNSLSGAIEALKASILRLPVVNGARVCALKIYLSSIKIGFTCHINSLIALHNFFPLSRQISKMSRMLLVQLLM